MVEFIHALTGTKMLVADNRAEEYKAAGHKLAADKKGSSTGVKKKPKDATEAKE